MILEEQIENVERELANEVIRANIDNDWTKETSEKIRKLEELLEDLYADVSIAIEVVGTNRTNIYSS